MFPKQRRTKILEIINSTGHATVESLAHTFGVSVDSIRKDLKVFSDEGLCRREYGGAFRVGDAPAVATTPFPDSPVLSDTADDVLLGDEGRRAVASRAYMEINDGDAVFLDISRTNLYLADLIAQGDKRLIVTTNMVEIPQRVSSNPKVTAFATGGYLNPQLTGFTGSASISLLEPLLFAKAFIGVNGINLKNSGVLSYDMDDGMVKQKVIANASYRFLMVDKDKFSIEMGYRFASITDFSAVITDATDPEILRAIAAKGVPVLC